MHYFLIGLAIGGISSLVGALISYRYYLAKREPSSPGPLKVTASINLLLIALGAIAILVSIVLGELVAAVIMGAGVFLGYVLVYVALLFFYSRRYR